MHSPDGGEDSLTYVEKIDTEVEIGTCEERVEATTEIVSYEEKVETEEKTGKKLQDQVAKERILDASLPVERSTSSETECYYNSSEEKSH
jgi:hypothetical protein